MSRLFALYNALESQFGPILNPARRRLSRRRHERLLTAAALGDEQLHSADGSWWSADPRWFRGGTPPSTRNRLTPLIDGEEYFARLIEALRDARHYVYITGWCLTPYVPLVRSSPEEMMRTRLLDVLADLATKIPVRVLLWGGAPFVLEPARHTAEATQRLINARSGDISCELDNTATATHCHHQKTVSVDGRVAFVGGLDLTTFAGDRWDASQHDLRSGVNWHDVAALVEGEAVADVERNFLQRWSAVTGGSDLPQQAPTFDAEWDTHVQIVRTIPAGCYDAVPNGEFGIRHTYLAAIKRAARFVYIESQYLWAPEIMEALIEAMDRPRSERFRIVIVLPAEATSGKWNNDQQVEELRKADNGRGIAEVYSLHSSGPCSGLEPFRHEATYVHAKVAIIDDEWFTIGSANLNDRGLITDGELNLISIDKARAAELRTLLWSEHLRLPKETFAAIDPLDMIDTTWKDCARENLAGLENGHAPLLSTVLRYQSNKTPGSGLLKRAQSLLLEH